MEEPIQIRNSPGNRVDACIRHNQSFEVVQQKGQFFLELLRVIGAFELRRCCEIESLIFEALDSQLILWFPVGLKEIQTEPDCRNILSDVFSKLIFILFLFFFSKKGAYPTSKSGYCRSYCF